MAIFILSSLFILIYLFYPQWLKKLKIRSFGDAQDKVVDNISIIYLSQNYAVGLKEKLSFLLNEIKYFENSELIVIDDASSDSSVEILQKLTNNKLRIITKENSKGVPHSMNLGVKLSAYQNIVFCDQRQILEKGIIKKLVTPLGLDKVGVVSSCISSVDKSKKFYFLRAHENYMKELEGQTGNLMGVYGPLYALKKECYHKIPDNIILDDLYLTLCILKNKQAVFQVDCRIYDENFEQLYSYKRAKRYLAGFFQILNDKELLSQLSRKQKIMLFWHKYFRIPIPLLIACSFVFLGFKSLYDSTSFYVFVSLSFLSIFILLPINLKGFRQIKSMVRFISFYSLASIELLVRAFILNQNIYEE